MTLFRSASMVAAIAMCVFMAGARAGASGVTPAGFVVTIDHEVKATPAQVFAAIGRVGEWWNGDHTWSGDAANLHLGLHAGDCFCEVWNDGSVEHARVINVARDASVVLQGSLGPMQGMGVTGILSFGIKPGADAAAGRSLLHLTYRVTGNADAGLDKLAVPVDRVLGEQVDRLVSFVEKTAPRP